MTGADLRQLRDAMGLTQEEFYAEMGYSRSQGYRYEAAPGEPVPLLVARAARCVEHCLQLSRMGVAFEGTLIADEGDAPLLAELGIRLGPRSEAVPGWTNCHVPPHALRRLGFYWGQIIWTIVPAPKRAERQRLPPPHGGER